MSNDYDLKCPKCGQDTEFEICATHMITIRGDHIDHDDSLTWDEDDIVTCGKCGDYGKVKTFRDDE